MKKTTAVLISVLIILSGFLSVDALDSKAEDNLLLSKYSPFEIVKMYPEFSSYLAGELRALNEDIDVRSFNIAVDEIDAVYFSVICENPDIFYIDAHNFETTSRTDSAVLVAIRPKYLFKTSEIPEKITEFNKAADYILKQINTDLSDVYKCRYAHDIIDHYVHYDMDIYSTNPNIRTAYGALCEQNAVCEGYSFAYNYILSKLNIEAHFIQSAKMQHGWSFVKIGNNYYHIDATYDDPSYDNLGRVNHNYCVLSDSGLKADGEHYDWICGIKANDKTYDNLWWKKVNTMLYLIDGYDYYMNQAYSGSVYGALVQHNISTGNERVIERITTRWLVDGNNNDAFWEHAYCYLTFDGNYLYYNDTEGVYRHKPDSSSYFDIVYKKPDSVKQNIYGIAMQPDGNLYISIKSSPNVEDIIYFLDKNILNQNSEEPVQITSDEYIDIDGGISITHYLDTSENIILPSFIDSKAVIALGDNLFNDRLNLSSIIIPDGVESIGNSIFYNCPKLKNLILPDTLTTIGNAAFYGCGSLEEIIIPKSVTKIGKNAFSGCINLTIKGYKGSAAESYASMYKINFEAVDEADSALTPVSPSESTAKSKTTVTQKLSMYVKQTAKAKPKTGSGYKFTSSKVSVASVNKNGLITAKRKGNTVIRIENSNVIYKIKLTVKNPSLNKTKKTLKTGKSFTLKIKGKAGKILFKSSNNKIASVNYKGKITAKRKGKATITVTTNGNIKLKCKITVQ